MKIIVLFITSILSSVAMCNEFAPESATDCLDRFQEIGRKVSRNSAVTGSARLSSINQPQFSKNFEWFLVNQRDGTKSSRSYSESRALYPHAPSSNVWEKRYIIDDKLYRALGDYLTVLQERERKEDEEDEKFLNSPTVGCPNMFSVALLAPGSTTLMADMAKLQRVVNQLVLFDETKNGDDIIGKFFASNFVTEIRFSSEMGYLPTQVKSYFYFPERPRPPKDESEYSMLWHECESQWKNLSADKDIWVPVRVKSILHRVNPKSSRGREIDATANWEFNIKDSLLTEENVELLPLDGPVAQLRKHLLETGLNSSVK